MSPVMINSLDSMAHYTSLADGRRKWAAMNNAPSAGGAFGAKGSDVLWKNLAAVTELEITGHHIMAVPGVPPAILTFSDTDGVQVKLILMSDGTLRLYNHNNTVLLAQTAAGVYQFNVTHHIWAKCVIDDAAGTFDIKIDGLPVMTAINLDTRWSVSATITQYATSGGLWSHVASGTGFTGQPRTGCVFASAAGEFDEFTPSAGTNVECIDEVAPDYTDFNDGDAPNLMDTFKFANNMPLTAIILGCVVTALIEKTEAGVCEIALVVKPPGAAEDVGPTISVPASPAFVQRFIPLNPNTGLAWTPAEANDDGVGGFRAGYKSITVTP